MFEREHLVPQTSVLQTTTPRTAAKVPLAESSILRAYAAMTPGSARLFARADGIFPNGVTHIGRYLQPHPLYAERALGPRKWDVDGNEYVDYFGGHGALMLGHNHPAVIEAVTAQLAKGVHFGASHELEIEWAELVRELIPCAERVRFTVTGTEATMLAFRIARAYTGKSKIVRFAGHFHGWHDQVAFSGAELPAGIPAAMASSILIAPPGDIAHFRALAEASGDIAAVILEPTGATFGHVPLPAGFLAELREITARLGILLIFDEVITGFRCSPGGAQGHYGITPDLATLAKVIAGGFPGAALAGRKDIIGALEYKDAGARQPAVPHQGTYNAGPISAAAGIATLRLLRSTDLIARANRAAAAIRDGLNSILRRAGVAWSAYGEFSGFHLFTNPDNEPVTPEQIQAGEVSWTKLKGGTPLALSHKVRTGFLLGGVDVVGWPGGVVSGVHGRDEVDRTLTAFEKLLPMLSDEGEIG